MTPADLAAFVTVMRESGVAVFRNNGLEIVLGAQPAKPLPRRDPDAPALPPRKSDYDRLLFACTEGLPDESSDNE